MRYTRFHGFENTILDEMMEEIKEERKQPSVTSLIYCLTKGQLDQQYGANPSRTTKLYFTIGLGLERNLLVGRKKELANGELEGISYHIDSLDNDMLVELKSTRMSTSTKEWAEEYFPERIPEGWSKQLKAYCKVTNRLDAYLVVLHIIQPEISCWALEFSQEEIDENWAWLISRRDSWNYFAKSNLLPPPYQYNMGWECANCSYNLICKASGGSITRP